MPRAPTLLVLLLLALPARAQELATATPPALDPTTMTKEERDARAKALFDEGRAHVDLGDYAAATRELEEAYVLEPLPLLLYNLAELAVYENRRSHALQLYGRYLQAERDPKERAPVERRMAELRRSLQKNPEPPEPAPAAPSEPPPAPSPPPRAQPAPPVAVSAPQWVASPPPRHRSRAWIWGVAIGGAVVVGGAVALGVVFGGGKADPTPSLGTHPLQ